MIGVSAMPAPLARVEAKGDIASALAEHAKAVNVSVLCVMTSFLGADGIEFMRELAVYAVDPKRLEGACTCA